MLNLLTKEDTTSITTYFLLYLRCIFWKWNVHWAAIEVIQNAVVKGKLFTNSKYQSSTNAFVSPRDLSCVVKWLATSSKKREKTKNRTLTWWNELFSNHGSQITWFSPSTIFMTSRILTFSIDSLIIFLYIFTQILPHPRLRLGHTSLSFSFHVH